MLSYPQLDEANIRIVHKHLEDNPQYLDNPECPYTESTKNVFRPTMAKTETIVNNIDRQIKVLDKLNAQLEKQSDRFDKGVLEPSEANAYFRQRISIAQEILGLQERLAHVQNVSIFFASVMEIMEDILDVDQRAEVMDKLRRSIEKEN